MKIKLIPNVKKALWQSEEDIETKVANCAAECMDANTLHEFKQKTELQNGNPIRDPETITIWSGCMDVNNIQTQ